MGATETRRVEQEIASQVEALRGRLQETTQHRREIESRANRLRSRLRETESRLESERERESALRTALRMAELAFSLATQGQADQIDLGTLSAEGDLEWEELTIADACWRILHLNFNRPMTNKELQQALRDKGKEVPLGSIATTLERYRDLFNKEKRGNVIYWSHAIAETADGAQES